MISIERVRKILEFVRSEGRNSLMEHEAKEIMKAYGIKVPKEGIATSEEEVLKIARKVEYPVVLKIASPDIQHKTDAGAVFLNLSKAEDILEGYRKVIQNSKNFKPDADIRGVIVQHMMPKQREVIIGVSKDNQFGHVLMFGLGGIFVEVLKDVSFRIIPIEMEDAYEMISEIRSHQMLCGVRGEKPSDIDALVDIMLKVSKFVSDFPEVKELDLNPVFVSEKGAVAVDALIVIE
ncbi:MAG: acetate--CoA ligase family protein [Candidatus Methanofastidiosum sp.]|nr:acetate--CoA ligase family protein [Methanofastidiosum sp.]